MSELFLIQARTACWEEQGSTPLCVLHVQALHKERFCHALGHLLRSGLSPQYYFCLRPLMPFWEASRVTWSRMAEVKVGSAWGGFPVGITHWQEPGRHCGRCRRATVVQLSRQEEPISGFKTTRRDTERVDLQELHTAFKHREVSSLSLLARSFQRSRRSVNAKVQGTGDRTAWPL